MNLDVLKNYISLTIKSSKLLEGKAAALRLLPNFGNYMYFFLIFCILDFSEAPCTSYLDQTVSLYPPHHSDNLWHYHNDVLLPAVTKT